MPRCLMAKKWKAYPWTDRPDSSKENRPENHREKTPLTEETEEEIDVVNEDPPPSSFVPKDFHYQNSVIQGPPHRHTERGKIQAPVIPAPTDHLGGLHQGAQPCSWGPSSPTEGATAPSPPPTSPSGSTILYNGYLHNDLPTNGYTNLVASKNDHTTQIVPQVTYTTLLVSNGDQHEDSLLRKKGLSPQMTYTNLPPPINHEHEHVPVRRRVLSLTSSTGAVLSLPPKKKDIYRPYSLEDRRPVSPASPLCENSPLLPFQHTIRVPAEEDLHAAHAILDLSASTTVFMPPNIPQVVLESHQDHDNLVQEQENIRPSQSLKSGNKTIAYTYEAFFVSDGRSKKRFDVDETSSVALAPKIHNEKPKYTCSECGKQYATSSNLSRHKQTHRSLDSQSAKKCMTCGKAYVSMPALAMHVLTHKLAHRCHVCGKQFSRPWLLQGHTRSHTGEKPYGCAHCGKAFADRSNLRAHMQTHSADKNFECLRCHKTFALKSYLNKHLESACLKEEASPDLVSSDLNTSLNQELQTIRVYAG